MSVLVVIIAAIVFAPSGQSRRQDYGIPELPSRDSGRNPKMMYFPFVKLVVQPDPCGNSKKGNNKESVPQGVCVPRGKCNAKMGQMTGDCANEFGECCLFPVTCNDTRNEIEVTTEVVELNHPSPINTECSFLIRKKKGMCQLKLDFVQYVSTGANQGGDCDRDRLTIEGSPTLKGNRFVTCGDLTDQHMYLEFGKSDSIDISPLYTSTSGMYKIIASQIPCVSLRRVPKHCLQYHNRTRGTIESFGFRDRQQQNNQEYTICVGGVRDAETITVNVCNTNEGNFSITGPHGPGLTPDGCDPTSDWIQLNGNEYTCRYNQMGGMTGIKSSFRPFLLNVHFNQWENEPLPCPNDRWHEVTDSTTCMDFLTNRPCMAANYDHCVFSPTPVRCFCHPKNPEQFESDIDNAGFCFEYVQT